MPYIAQKDRAQLDSSIRSAVDALKAIDHTVRPGAANYVVSRIVLGALKPPAGWSYHSISRAMAALRDAADEMRRRLMDHREDAAIKTNGDLPEYAEF